ncbi:MAG TPA: alkylmercury lyase family protein [Micromonosporaceae bacterium]|nr:alkylmercury lyase family protein [Micromonosporaceae bacterium]
MPTPSDAYPPGLSVGVTSSRIAHVSRAARTVHTAILRAFAATGAAPDAAMLAGAVPAGHELGVLLRELHDHDVVRLDDQGGIRAAYPFSGVATAHRVAIGGGPVVYAMCAVDALGIAAMLGRDTTITSTDPTGGQEIEISVLNGQTAWRPDTAVVSVGSDTTAAPAGGDCCPPGAAAVDRCCGVMNFFATPTSAQAWLAAHPAVSGVVLTQQQSLRLGVDIFGHLLDDGPDSPTTGDPS